MTDFVRDESEIVVLEDQPVHIEGLLDIIKKENLRYTVVNPEDQLKRNLPLFSNIKLLVLDLIYGVNPFDVDMVLGWVVRIIPEHQVYQLLVWSRHAEYTAKIIEEMTINKRRPQSFIQCNKMDFLKDTQKNSYDWIKIINKASSNINGFSSKLANSFNSKSYLYGEKYQTLSQRERRMWRVFLSIKKIDTDSITANIPGWSSEIDIIISLASIPKEFHPSIKEQGKYFVNANIGVASVDKLVVENFEVAEQPTEEFYDTFIHN